MRPAIASAASAATRATTCDGGRERSYQAKPASRTAPRIRKLASCQLIASPPIAGAPQRGRALLGGDHARQVEHPRDLGREVPAAGEHLGAGAVGDHDAVAEQDDALGERGGELDVVGGDDDRGAGAAPARSISSDELAPCGRGPCPGSARRGRRGPGSSSPRHPARQRDRQRQPLALAAGEVARVGVDGPLEADGLERARALPRPAARRRPARGPGSRPGSGSAARMPPGPRSVPRTGSTSPASAAQQRALAGAVPAHQRHPLAAADLEVDPAQHVPRPLARVELDPQVRASARARVAPVRRDVFRAARHCAADRRRTRRRHRPARPSARLRERRRAAFTDPTGSGSSPASEKSRAAGSRARGRGRAPRRGSRAGAPSKAIAPASIATTRSAAARQRSRRCSPSRTATPHSSLRRRSSQISSSPATGSSCEVGSSSRTSGGRVTRAAASATRCSSPPERVSTVRSSRCGIASASATSSTARARARRRVAAQLQRQRDLGADGGRDDLGLGVLGDVADAAGELARAGVARVEAGDLDPPGDLAAVEVRHEAAGGAQQRRLARARAAGEDDELARRRPRARSRASRRAGVRDSGRRGPRAPERGQAPVRPPSAPAGRAPAARRAASARRRTEPTRAAASAAASASVAGRRRSPASGRPRSRRRRRSARRARARRSRSPTAKKRRSWRERAQRARRRRGRGAP